MTAVGEMLITNKISVKLMPYFTFIFFCRYVIQPSSMFAIPTRINRKRCPPKPKSWSNLRDVDSENDSSDTEGRMPERIGRAYSVPAPSGTRFRIGTVEDI